MKKTSKTIYITFILCFIFIFALCLTSSAAFVVGNNTQNLDNIQGTINSSVISVPYNEGADPYDIYYQYFYTANHVNDFYCFYVDNEQSFLTDLSILEGSLHGSVFNDAAVVNFLVNKYPNTDFSKLYFLRLGTTDYLVTLYYNTLSHVSGYINTGYQDGYYVGLDTGYIDGYTEGYNSAIDLGYDEGYNAGYINGTNEGYTNGYGEGYTEGTYNGMNETEMLKTGLLTIFSSPLYVLGGVLDFEIFGLNLFNLISTLLTILLFAFVVKHLLL